MLKLVKIHVQDHTENSHLVTSDTSDDNSKCYEHAVEAVVNEETEDIHVECKR